MEIKKELKKGFCCNYCGQYVKVYRRRVHKSMVQALKIFLDLSNRYNKESFFSINFVNHLAPGDFAKLRFWALIEHAKNTDSSKKDSGKWRITKEGIEFLQKKRTIPKYVLIYNNKFLGYEGEEVSVEQCLGRTFSYAELMKT